MKKTYADQCLERAKKATGGPWKESECLDYILCEGEDSPPICEVGGMTNLKFIAHARQDVPELARRLSFAIEIIQSLNKQINESHSRYINLNKLKSNIVEDLVQGLEAMPEDK